MEWRKSNIVTGFLLVVIGILIGVIIVLAQQDFLLRDKVDVKYTDIKRVDEVDTLQNVKKVDFGNIHSNFQEIARKVIPTVVYIESTVPVQKMGLSKDENHDFWDRFLPKQEVQTVGSGVIISSDGYILTNNHVVEKARHNEVSVTLSDKRTFTGKIVGTDSSTDLAVIKINANHLPAISIGNSNKLQVGDWVLAIGNPFRLRSTVTAGIVSALGRDVSILDDRMGIEDFIQTDAAINRGNSGGALVNSYGNLIGINTAIATETGSYEGYGFAIPSNLAIKVAHDIIQYGKVRRAFLGVQIQSVTDKRAHELGMKKIEGVEIVNIAKNSATYKAGVRPHDVVLSVNGTSVNESNQLQAEIAMLSPGNVVQMKILRGKKIINVKVPLMSYGDMSKMKWALSQKNEPLKIGPNNSSVFKTQSFDLGFTVTSLVDSKDFDKFSLVITKIKDGSEAQRRGLKRNYIILEIDNQKVRTIKQLRKAIESGLSKNHSILIKIQKPNGVIGFYELEQK